jgi:predicted dehydrogenase
MVEAARRYKRIVQVGTQNRSAPYVHKALDYINSGKLGDIPLCKVFNLKSGGPFRMGPDSVKPDELNWDAWLGPTPKRPYNERIHHGGWHGFWAFSGGDMADDGTHQLDIARWLTGKDYPKGVHCSGGNLAFPDDDREVPDTQVVTYDFDDLVMTFELSQWAPYMSKTPGSIRDGDRFPYWPQNATRVEFYGTKQMMMLGRHGGGWQIFTGDGKIVSQEFGRRGDDPHRDNFIECIRSRRSPTGDIEEGHRSAVLVHLANLSCRLGGRELAFDAETESFAGDEEANRLLKRTYRKPFVIPDRV